MHVPQFEQQLSASEVRVIPTWLTGKGPLYELLMMHKECENS